MSRQLPSFEADSLSALLRAPLPVELEALLREHIRAQRWFRGKARNMSGLAWIDQVPLRAAPNPVTMTLVQVSYGGEDSEVYVLPLAQASEAPAATAPLFELRTAGGSQAGVVFDPTGSDDFSQLLLALFVRDRTRGDRGDLRAQPSAALRALSTRELRSVVPKGEQSNTTIFFAREFMIKLFRRLEAGENPDLELNLSLWARGYRHVPEPLGSLAYESADLRATLGIAQRFVPSRGPAWEETLAILKRSFERARTAGQMFALPSDDLLVSAREAPPKELATLLGEYVEFAKLLGERTAELHLALAAADLPGFEPEPFTREYQQELVQAVRERVSRNYALLTGQLHTLQPSVKSLAQRVLASRDALFRELAAAAAPIQASRIRCHGDYHLGQVLYDGSDFTILDFEGEPAQPLEARRQTCSALYDVCGMLQSFHYAATVALQAVPDGDALAAFAQAWYRWTSALFLGAYLNKAGPAVFLPQTPAGLRALLRLHMIDKCGYELGYELNNRPDWVFVPLAGLAVLSKRSEQ